MSGQGKTETKGVVSRAELKIAEATKAFGFNFRGKVVLDIGSSTGGFTEFALRQGAKKVIAIEKGTNQMKAPLRFDPRVELHEKTDFLELKKLNKGKNSGEKQGENEAQLVTALQVGEVNAVMADVSFVSLKEILTKAKELVPKKAEYLVMLKPQFEAYPDQLVNGVVKNEKMRREIVQEFEHWLTKNGFLILKKRDNETVGKIGKNRERFYWLRVAS